MPFGRINFLGETIHRIHHHKVMDDKQVTINRTVNAIKVDNALCNELGRKKVSPRWVPPLLLPDQKMHQADHITEKLYMGLLDLVGFRKRLLTQSEC